MTTTARTRHVDGKTVPAPGAYRLDPHDTRARFEVKKLFAFTIRGGFEDVAGTVEVGDDPTASRVAATIDASSIKTPMAPRDRDLKGPKFLDVENYPTIEFVSTRIEPTSDGWKLHGDLTIKDVTRSVSLDMKLGETGTNDRLVFTASTELVRSDWDDTWRIPFGRTGLVVSKTWQLDIEAHVLPA